MKPTALTLCFLTLVAPTWWGSETNDGTGLFVAHGFTSQSVISSLPTLSKSLGSGLSRHRRPYGYYATTDEEQKSFENELETAKGDDAEASHEIMPDVNGAIDSASIATNSTNSKESIDFAAIAMDMNTSMVELLGEISQRINDGSTEIMKDITNVLDEQLTQVPDAKAQELTVYLTELTNKLQKAQEDEIQRQIQELEKLFVSPLERVAFSDAPLFDLKETKKAPVNKTDFAGVETQLVLAGANSTLRKSARQGTTMELIKNLNVAPLYYSVALFYRWIGKSKNTITLPSLYLISAYKSMANVIKTRGGPRRRTKKENKLSTNELYNMDAEAFQSGWKRTGEIAAKGPWLKKWAVLRRSAEVWAYFSSFYIKDRRICKNFESGKWTEEKFTHERSRLGAEITQNLLRLGPTFIKVRRLNSSSMYVIRYPIA
jgi:hypothetical protein